VGFLTIKKEKKTSILVYKVPGVHSKPANSLESQSREDFHDHNLEATSQY